MVQIEITCPKCQLKWNLQPSKYVEEIMTRYSKLVHTVLFVEDNHFARLNVKFDVEKKESKKREQQQVTIINETWVERSFGKKKFPKELKIILVGANGVGKSSWMKVLEGKTFDRLEKYIETINFDLFEFFLFTPDQCTVLKVTEVGGETPFASFEGHLEKVIQKLSDDQKIDPAKELQERLNIIKRKVLNPPHTLREGQAVFIVVGMNDQSSFYESEAWFNTLKERIGKRFGVDVPIWLIGLKNDEKNDNGDLFATLEKNYGIDSFLVSSKELTNVDEPLITFLLQI